MDLSAFIGKRDVRREKTTQAQVGTDFAVLRAQESTRVITQRIKQKFGALIEEDEQRPWPGAFAIVSEDMVALCLRGARQMLGLATALTPLVGYDRAAQHAMTALRTGQSLEDVVVQSGDLSAEDAARVLDPATMARGGVQR